MGFIGDYYSMDALKSASVFAFGQVSYISMEMEERRSQTNRECEQPICQRRNASLHSVVEDQRTIKGKLIYLERPGGRDHIKLSPL